MTTITSRPGCCEETSRYCATVRLVSHLIPEELGTDTSQGP